MRVLALAGGTTFSIFLLLFGLGEAWSLPLLSDPAAHLRQANVPTALLGVGLLVVDAALPVPSSLVMIAHGAVFGVVVGTLLSVVGSTCAAMIGFLLGRRGGDVLDRLVSADERATADRLLARWGALAILITRPVPLLAETVTVLAGASPLGWRRAALAALAGSVPAALIYAMTGAAVAASGSGALVLAAVVLLAGGTWLAGRALHRRGDRDRRRGRSVRIESGLTVVGEVVDGTA